MRYFFLLLFAFCFGDLSLTKKHLLFLMRSETPPQAVERYRAYKEAMGEHDFEVLEQLGNALLERGMGQEDPESQMLSLYGAGMAGLDSCLEICTRAMRSRNPAIQLAALQVLGQMQDDAVSEIVCRGLSSPFFPIRMEASYILATRRHPKAVGYIEGLKQKVPPEFGFAFPDLYGQVGTPEAALALRHLFADPVPTTRLATILAAAKYGRDDLLKEIRAAASHLQMAEQEAAAFALGQLGDSHSLPRLRALKESGCEEVRLSAAFALFELGESDGMETILSAAKNKNLFAIQQLAMAKTGEDLLAELLKESDRAVRFNAAISLLRRHDPRCRPVLFDLLISNRHDLGFEVHPSPGRALVYWKVIPSAFAYAKTHKSNTLEFSAALREQLLFEALELPEETFIQLGRELFAAQQKDLIPTLVHLLVNLRSEASIALLREGAQKMGAPFVRAYCSLGLYQIETSGPHKEAIVAWLKEQSKTQMIRFRDVIPKMQLPSELARFSLNADETSRLLLESYEAIATRGEPESLDILLDAIHDGNEKNRYALAGLLLKALQ